MKLKNRFFVVLFSVLAIVSILACGLPATISREHDKLVELYQNADAARSTAYACFDMNGGKVRTAFAAYNRFLDANTEAVQAWKAGPVAEAQAKLVAAQNAANETENSDLNAAVEEGGTPADLYAGYALQINAYAEAPWTGLSEDMYISIQDLIEESYSTTFGCIKDWNDNVKAYNVERSRIAGLADSGRIIGDAANALGVTELPLKLPYYESPESALPIGSDFYTEPTP